MTPYDWSIMFTILVQLWLFIVVTGFLVLALQAAYVTLRDGRQKRLHLEAHFYARLVVSDRILAGELNGASVADLNEAYEFEKIAYLNR